MRRTTSNFCQARCLGLTAVALLIALFQTPNALADDELDSRKKISLDVKTAWEHEDFHALESVETLFLSADQRTSSGKWRLAIFFGALESGLTIEWPNEWNHRTFAGETVRCYGPEPAHFPDADKRWNVVEERLKRWAAEFPQSPNPQLALAAYFMNRGWFYRGTCFAGDVIEVAWPIFYRNLDTAQQILAGLRNSRTRNPVWFDLMLRICSAKSADPTSPDRKSLIDDLLENGQGYPNAYSSALRFMEPRWGGSPRQLEDFAQIANAKTLKEEGGAMYARIYWNFEASYEYGTEFFQKTNADWPKLKASFQKLVNDYPTPRNVTGFARFSCMAKDVAGAKQLLQRAGTDEYLESWVPAFRLECLGH